MTGWLFLIGICWILASIGVAVLVVIAVGRIRKAWRDGIWARAYVLAHDHPALVVEVVDDLGLVVASPPAATIDAMSHTELVDTVLAHEEHEAQLAAEIEDTITGKNAELAAARAQLRAEHVERERQERAKRRHWATINRLKSEASDPEGAIS